MNTKIAGAEPVRKEERFIEITPEMISAGLTAMLHGRYFSQMEMIKNVYRAMRRKDRS